EANGRSQTPDQAPFTLEVSSQPPSRVRVGQPLNPGLNVDIRRVLEGGGSSFQAADTGRLFAVATLMMSNAQGATVIAGNGVLTGPSMVTSVQPLMETSESDSEGMLSGGLLGTAGFADLAIRDEGLYRLRIALMRVGNSGSSNVAVVESNYIAVERQ
ncbi:hypothetical protein LTS18_006088, partial [Coniosporium uncinatum]